MRAWLLIMLLLGASLTACSGPQSGDSTGVQPLEQPGPGGISVPPRQRHVSRGQVLYVPGYSQVYLMDGKLYNLAITLSIRNTSRERPLVVQSVGYYDSAGKLVKNYADHEIELGPLATTEFFVRENDPSGGPGASFLVRWVAETEIPDPVVEAVMVGTGGGQGVSFVTESRVLENLGPPASTPAP